MLTNLFIHWHADPVLIHLGNFGIRWYSLLFVGGFILGYYIFRKMMMREGLDGKKLLDPLLYTLLLCTIVGSRLGHCIFYQPDYYFGSWQGFLEIFQPWKGGLASHGGAIALVLGMLWYSNKYGKPNNFDFLWIMDRLCLTVAFAGCFIRLGNLFNSEIYGNVTTLPWGIVFDLRKETEPKHPTQLYEAFSYLVTGLIMLRLYNKRLEKLHRGFLFGFFLVCCFGMRFIIEFVKEPQVEFEKAMTLDMGQILSIPFIIAGIGLMVYAGIKKKPAGIVKTAAGKR